MPTDLSRQERKNERLWEIKIKIKEKEIVSKKKTVSFTTCIRQRREITKALRHSFEVYERIDGTTARQIGRPIRKLTRASEKKMTPGYSPRELSCLTSRIFRQSAVFGYDL